MMSYSGCVFSDAQALVVLVSGNYQLSGLTEGPSCRLFYCTRRLDNVSGFEAKAKRRLSKKEGDDAGIQMMTQILSS
jgi:hypothetical protein